MFLTKYKFYDIIILKGDKIMTKCDFCTKSSPSGKCFWSLQVARENDCKKAIKRMTEALKRNYEK